MSGPRILIVKFSAIGDCVMTAHAVSMIRRNYPLAFIVWAVDPRCGDVVDTDHLVDVRYDIPRELWKKNRVSSKEQLEHFRKLREFDFDYGFDMQGHAKTAICLKLARPKKRIAMLAKDPAVRLLTRVARHARGRVHMVERNIDTIRKLLPIEGSTDPIMPSLETDSERVREAVSTNAPIASIAVSAGRKEKEYPLQDWAEVAFQLKQQGYQPVFIGGKSDRAPTVAGALDLVGKLPLNETMALVKMSAVHLAADTGSGHIAAAYGVPVVSIFGWSDPAKYRPFTDLETVLDAGRSMSGVDPNHVVKAAVRLVEGDERKIPH